jgi:transposase
MMMGRAYGIDLRERVVAAIEGGLSHRQASEWFRVAVSTAGNWHRLWRRTGSARPGRQGHPVRSRLDAHEAANLAMVEDNKDIALSEIAERLADEHGIHAAPSTVWHFFKKRAITFKKRPRTRPSRSAKMC